jgi:hypothetical protein
MTDTLFSRRSVVDLAELSWDNLGGCGEQWRHFFDLLAVLHSEQRMLGHVAGTLELVCGPDDEPNPDHATWSVETAPSDLNVLRERVAASSVLLRPFTARLNCAPIVLLPDGLLHITDYDSIEQYSRGHATLAPTSDAAPVDGLTPWRIDDANEQSSLLYFDISFGVPTLDDGMWAVARSHCDLWLPTRLDGEPNLPHGPANAQLLAECIERVVRMSNAQPG